MPEEKEVNQDSGRQYQIRPLHATIEALNQKRQRILKRGFNFIFEKNISALYLRHRSPGMFAK